MTINEYQQAALRTANKNLNSTEQLTNGLMGLNGEAGECIDILKKHLFQGHDLDRRHIAMELGGCRVVSGRKRARCWIRPGDYYGDERCQVVCPIS